MALEALRNGDPARVGPYVLRGRLGSGGMGTVYLGFDDDGKPVAIKTLPAGVGDDLRRRLHREAELLQHVSHPRVASFLAADVAAAMPWIAMTYISGPSLAEVSKPLSEPALSQLLTGLADALAALHLAGLSHRDVKPGNIIMTFDGPVLVDLGIATAADLTALTIAGTTVGTPGWMSPEQLTGNGSGPAGDIWAWGAVAFYAAAGLAPFGNGTLAALAWRIQHSEPDYAQLPPTLRAPVQAALAKRPGQRPTAAELRPLLNGVSYLTQPADATAAPTAPAAPATVAAGTRVASPAADGASTELIAPGRRPHRRYAQLLAAALTLAVMLAGLAIAISLHRRGPAHPAAAATTPTVPTSTANESRAPASSTPPPSSPSPTPSPIVAEITAQRMHQLGVCAAACTITGRVPFVHPVWGSSTLVTTTSLANGIPVGPAHIAVIDENGAVQWSVALANMWSLAPAPTPTDTTGHLFLNYNPGRYNGVIVLDPIGTGMDDFHSIPPDRDPAAAAFYASTVVDANHDGVFEIDRSVNNCVPDCADGSQVHTIYVWNGTAYVRAS